MENQYYDNNESNSSNELIQTEKTPAEIIQSIKKALVNNKILGHLQNNILYMKSFGANNSLDKIFNSIGVITILIGSQMRNIEFIQGAIILSVGIGSLIIGVIFAKLLKHYLIYDIDKEVFYTITNIHNFTIKKSKEIPISAIIELGVDVTDKEPNNEQRVSYQFLRHKGDLLDNPGLRTSFVGLLYNGKKINISDPVALREPHQIAVERCKFFAECFGLNSVICNKNEALKIEKDNKSYKFTKYSKDKEWEKVKRNNNIVLWIVFLLMFVPIIILIIIFATR